MSVTGRIAVDVQFADATTAAGVQSLKTITLQDAAEYTSGKVAVVTGTVGVSSVSIDVGNLTYRNASGALVSFSAVTRAVLKSSAAATLSQSGSTLLYSSGGVGVSDLASLSGTLTVASPGPTAAYTLILYGT